MLLRFWLLGRHTFRVSMPFCLLIGRTFAGLASFCAFGCSVGAPVAFPCLFLCLLAARLLVACVFALFVSRYARLLFLLAYWLHICWLGMFLRVWLLVGSPFAFPCLFACLLAAPLLCWIFWRNWLLGKSSFAFTLSLCLLIGHMFAGVHFFLLLVAR